MAAVEKRYSVVLSDVHIGDNSPTCWYQAKFHDEYLNRALQYIVDHSEAILDVMLLGDMFDVWTYPPDKQPPDMAHILAANPTLLGPKGMLAKVCKAIPKQVRIILGNHDGTLTQADIDLLNKNMGFAPR